MKKLLLFILIATSIVACTRKQNPRELDSDETLAKYPVQCYNGSQDTDESGIDCGGPCEPCNVVTPSCTPVANTVKIGSSTFATVGSSCSASGSEYQMTGSYASGSYSINLGSSTPNLSIAYTMTTSVPNSTEAYVTLSDGSLGTLSLNSGTVILTQVGGVYIATICGGNAHSWVTSFDYTVDGNFSCP